MVYDVYLLCELYLLSLKILIFVSFKINKFLKIKDKKKGVLSFIKIKSFYASKDNIKKVKR